jgi:hypothetical protein
MSMGIGIGIGIGMGTRPPAAPPPPPALTISNVIYVGNLNVTVNFSAPIDVDGGFVAPDAHFQVNGLGVVAISFPGGGAVRVTLEDLIGAGDPWTLDGVPGWLNVLGQTLDTPESGSVVVP